MKALSWMRDGIHYTVDLNRPEVPSYVESDIRAEARRMQVRRRAHRKKKLRQSKERDNTSLTETQTLA